MIGESISHYKIIEKLGEGGMGIVFKAHDTRLDRSVALKFLPSQGLETETDRARFVHEAQAAASLHHPNICTIHEIGEHNGQLFIVMALIEGENLQDRIATGPLPVQNALDTAIQIASGLQAAHESGIVHRDIKPANVMIDTADRAHLMDFGLARRQDSTRLTQTGTTLGTFAYMSPEQLSGEDPDHRSDIWALGAVLFETVTGRPAFKGDMEPALMYSILNKNPGSVTELRPEAPAGFEGIIARALEKSPQERYQDAGAMLADLESLRNDPTAFPAGIPASGASLRKKLATGAAIFTVLMAAAVAIIVPRLGDDSQAIHSLAILSFANLSGDSEQDIYAAGLHAELISTLGKIDQLVVLGRRSVLKYEGSDLSPREIAEELGVAALMEGSVSLVGDRMIVTAELVRAATGQILWTDSFDEQLSDALGFQRRIALAVARGIQAGPTPELRNEQIRQVDPEAYRLYLKFRANWFSSDAREILKQAVAIDDSFAEAWAALANRTAFSTQYGHISKEEGYPLSRQAAEKAINLDPNLATAHMAMATVHWQQEWDWERAYEEVDRAAALDPMHSFVRSYLANKMFLTGRITEGIAHYEELIALNPLDPSPRQVLGWHLGNIGLNELAVEHLGKNRELFPDHYFTNMLLALGFTGLGRFDKAMTIRKEMEQTHESLRFDADGDGVAETGLGPRFSKGGGTGLLVRAYANTEARVELEETLEEARGDFEADPTAFNAWLVAFYLIPLGQGEEAADWLEIAAEGFLAGARNGAPRAGENVLLQAYLYSSLGEKEKAYEWLELAFDLRATGLQDLYRRSYRFAELWSDERYEGLMRRRGFPEEVIESLRPSVK